MAKHSDSEETVKKLSYRKEIESIVSGKSIDPTFIAAINGLKVTIGDRKTTDDSLREIRRNMRTWISRLDLLIFREMSMKEFTAKYIKDPDVTISIYNMTELRKKLSDFSADIEDYFGRQNKAKRKAEMEAAGFRY